MYIDRPIHKSVKYYENLKLKKLEYKKTYIYSVLKMVYKNGIYSVLKMGKL